MSMEWNRNLYERIRAAADRGAVHHALLLTGRELAHRFHTRQERFDLNRIFLHLLAFGVNVLCPKFFI